MVHIQSAMADAGDEKKRRQKIEEEETTGRKYNARILINCSNIQ